MKERILQITKTFLWGIAVTCIFSSIAVVVRASLPGPYSWAQCGADSYIECTGGIRCTATDNVGCRCYDNRGVVVYSRKCSEAAP